ncbi:glycosyltransferase family 2 protein [Thalassorhabdus alkalitolerans]|uniref:Glycosyltransferase family 2 protein n=1 Tax=Thalassorhabdus alkalitolerans TaxID=2282697 RepID=A0ABW0YK28_9BACI
MLVSIVMAVYNGELFLKDAINGILSQTYSEIEVIIVDDGSSDQTKKILDEINDQRVRIIHLNRNQGAANALNIGIDHSKGEWIAIHDADDISFPERIEEQVAHIKSNKSLVAVGTFIECIDKSNRKRTRTLGRNNFTSHEEIKALLYNGCPLTHGSMMFSKSAFYEAGQYNPNYKIAYDYELWCRLINIGSIENVPKVLYRYRIYDESLSHKNDRQTCIELFNSFSTFLLTNNFVNKSKKPSFILVGTENGCNTFMSVTNLKIKKKINIDRNNAGLLIIETLKNKNVDGVIVLGKPKDKKILLEYLIKNGMKKNENLFDFWSSI